MTLDRASVLTSNKKLEWKVGFEPTALEFCRLFPWASRALPHKLLSDPVLLVGHPGPHRDTSPLHTTLVIVSRSKIGSGRWNCTTDLQVMSLTSFYFSTPQQNDGGPDKDRTCDIQLAKLALSQLSYRPVIQFI